VTPPQTNRSASGAVPHSIGEKRVLQVVLSLNPGGTERLVVEIVKRLLHEMPMAVCCLDEDGSWAGDLKAHGVDVVSLNRTSGFKPVLGRAIAHAARRHRASVMHCHHYSPFVYGCISRIWYPGCRIIFTEHGRLDTSPPSPKRRLANRALRTIPDEVFAVSQDLRRHLAAEGFREADVDVIYNGIDVGPQPDARARQRVRTMLGVDAGALVVGTIARLDPVKDLGTLVRATIDVARETPVLLMIVGDGPDRERLRALAAESHGACTVRFLGHRDDARELLAGCDIYANSSVSEGVSLTILEAMAAGLPVVATRVGGTPEIIDGDSGRLVAAQDSAALASALRDLAAHPAVRQALGRAARRRVEQQFSLDRMVREYREAYARAAA
jgi:L-malate glycosyltransferase